MTDIHENDIAFPAVDFTPNPKGLGVELYEKLHLHRDLVGQVHAETGDEDTFGHMLKIAKGIAVRMQQKFKLKPGDVVSISSYNLWCTAPTWLAAIFIGCKVACLDVAYSEEDVKRFLSCIKPKIAFVMSEAVKNLEKAKLGVGLDFPVVVYDPHPSNTKQILFEEFMGGQFDKEIEEFEPVPCNDLRDTVLISFSSGSTGFPKGICLHHLGFLTTLAWYSNLTVRKGARLATYLTLYGITQTAQMMATIAYGMTNVLLRKFTPHSFWKAVSDVKINAAILAPYELITLTESADIAKQFDVSSLRMIVVGGAPTKESQLLKARKTFPQIRVVQVMGQTETHGPLFMIPKEESLLVKYLSRPTSVGRLIGGVTARIVDLDTEDILGPNKVGELRLKSDTVFNGYHEKNSSECFDKNGWYRTGDLMFYDEDKLFYHVERYREMFKYRLVHLQPAVLEEILGSHPAVVNCLVIGVAHEVDENWPMALVILNDEGKRAGVTEQDLLDYYNKKVDENKKMRGGLKFVKEFPVTVTGKVLRRKAKQMVLDGTL